VTSRPVAAVDCGTNSTRLLVVDAGGAPLERCMRITRLGAGVDRTGRLDGEAIRRTAEVLAEYAGLLRRHGVAAVRATATSAARDAANREELFAAVEAALGVRPELLSGEEEATLSFLGATAELAPGGGPWLVADIGGGSTELAVGPDPGGAGRPAAVRSLDMGCVRVTERFLLDDPATTDQRAAAAAFVDAQLDAAWAARPELATPATLVGLAGTVSAAVSLERRLAGYDRALVHHAELRRETVDALLAELGPLSAEQRRARPGMEPGRADVIVGGLIVLSRLMARARAARCLVSESDILDGLAASLLG